VLVGIEQSKLLLGEELASKASHYIIDKNRLKELEKKIRTDDLEGKRKNGLYVDVSPKDGRISNSPSRVSEESARSLLRRVESLLGLGKILCNLFRDIRNRPRTSLQIRRVVTTKNHGVGIVFDEI